MDAKIGSISYSQEPVISGEHFVALTTKVSGGEYESGTVLVSTASGIEGLVAGMLPASTDIYGVVIESTGDVATACVHGVVLKDKLKYADGTPMTNEEIATWEKNLRAAGLYLR